MTTLHLRTLIERSRLRLGFVLIPLAVAGFALSPASGALNPPPDGGYPNRNTAEGEGTLNLLDIGTDNTAIGFNALNHSDGNSNTAIGSFALTENTEGNNNTATGVAALENNEAGQNNTANGTFALFACISNDNTATGFNALACNQGSYNTATGASALAGVCGQPMPGSYNTASGFQALFSNVNGFNNTASGVDALHSNDGNNNTAIGFDALLSNTTGINNIALGFQAGQNLTTGKNNIDIGNAGVAGETNKIRIGTTGVQRATFIAGINGVTVPAGVGVIVGTDGKLGTVVSSQRYKDAIKPMDKASEAILALKPVTFRYKPELDPEGIPQFGLVAEEVEKVDPDLVARDEEGKPYTVRYEAVNAMLLNEFLKEHRRVEEQQATIAKLKSTVAQQQEGFEAKLAKEEEQIETLTAGLQNVNAQLEESKSAPRVVLNNP